MSALIALAPGKYARGFDGTGREVPAAYEVVDVREALERVYATDAHLVTYVVRGAARQPRINKPGLPHFEGAVETTCFFCDIDNEGHAEWTDALVQSALREYDEIPALRTAGIYHTAHGRRIVQPLAEPIAVQQVEPYLRRWLLELEAAGLVVDWACRDWTRHFRLPHVRRAGRSYRSPFVALERMAPIALAPLPIADPDPPGASSTRAARALPAVPLTWTTDVPPPWRARVVRIAAAVRQEPHDWHHLFLALAGALLARGVPAEHIPALNRAISLATGTDTRTEDRERAGRSTVERSALGERVAGHAALRRTWPRVADAIDAALASGAEARAREQARANETALIPPLAETTTALEAVIRNAPDGLTLVSAECGLGKTAAIRRVAQERASKPYATATATGKRAPAQSKTAISVDKNALAVQITRDLRAAGARVRRVFGPLSILGADGTPECRFHETARPLVEGGQPMQWEFCRGRGEERCEFYDECTARDGEDGPADARIIVGTHALLSQLDAAAGSTGLLVIDEPPALLESVILSVEAFDVALGALSYFVGAYADAMRPALRAIRAWVAELAELEQPTELADGVRAAADHVAPAELRLGCRAAKVEPTGDVASDVFACVRGAQLKERLGRAPPIERVHVFVARRAVAFATQLGTASKVLRAVHYALTTDQRVAARVEERGEHRALVLTMAREDLANAVKREGAVVVADANADLHAPVLAKVVGYAPRVHRFAAADGAPIARTLLRARGATRTGWFSHGRLVVDAAVVAAVQAAIDWAKEDSEARDLAVITFRPLAIALRAAREPGTPFDRDMREKGQTAAALARAREALAPVLARWPGRILVAHYGGVRGLDWMKDVDCLATIGDPWPNLGEVRHDIAFLGLEQAWESRLEAMCRAELEQAHGRLRAVHRTRPGRALHVGNSLPSGAGWTSGGVEIRHLDRRRSTEAMVGNELVPIIARLGGVRPTARLLGCSPTTITRYVSGERVVPRATAMELRALVAEPRSVDTLEHVDHPLLAASNDRA